MSAKDKIWRYLIEHNRQATNAELAQMLRGHPGQLSIGQRLRELRQEMWKKGGDISCTELRPGIYRYKIIDPEPPRPEQEEAIAENNLAQETEKNMAAV